MDFTQDMLPDGYRPLLEGEHRQTGDEFIGGDPGEWIVAALAPAWNGAANDWCHHRTRRPLPTAETVMPSITTLAQDQVQAPEASVEVVNKHFHDLLLKGDADGWIPWAGGECPVSKNIMIEYRTRGVRNVRTRHAGYATWSHRGWDSDIVAYRIAEPAPIMVPLGPEDVLKDLTRRVGELEKLLAKGCSPGIHVA